VWGRVEEEGGDEQRTYSNVLEVFAVRQLTQMVESVDDADWPRRLTQTVAVRAILLVEVLASPATAQTPCDTNYLYVWLVLDIRALRTAI